MTVKQIDIIIYTQIQKGVDNMKNIKILRKDAQLSQADFASMFHVHQTAVSQWE